MNFVYELKKQYGYDGIDLDIEQDFGSPAHTDYVACVSGVRTALNAINPRPILTEDGDPDWQAYMLVQVWKNLDQINLMSYWNDVSGMASRVNNYTTIGIPKSLLGVGIGIADGGNGATNIPDCAAKAQYAITNGLGGVMEWTVQGDAVLHNGQYPCMDAVGNYVH